ncbi:MAG: hypothetical protein EXR35_11330 [Limnohabitans sp.]|nr:hypothetical protein [Limnohabitans sp.]
MQAVTHLNTQRFHHFLAELTRLIDSHPDEPQIIQKGSAILSKLIAHDDWLAPEHAQPHPQHYQQFLLYADPQDRYSVVSFVWGPGQATPIHDHTVWGLIGMLRGSEITQPYARMADGRWAPAGLQIKMLPGDVEAVSPRIGDVHKVENAFRDQTSISIHVYGANIGKVERHVYLQDGTRKPFISGYSNVQVAQTVPASLAPSVIVNPNPVMRAPAAQPTVTQAAIVKVPDIKPAMPPAPATVYAEAHDFELISTANVKQSLIDKKEIVLVDVREEDPFAQCHPLFAVNMPIGRIEADTWRRIPRRDTPIVIYDGGEGLAVRAAQLCQRMGYTNVNLLDGGLSGWAVAGGELFKDVNVPSKSFGELVEAKRHTPSLSAQEVKALIDQKADIVVLDVRRFDEYQAMSIPSAISVPGGELALRARTIAPNASTRIIVNCAGRTRSIIGTQALINSGIPNPVAALRNGTIGWTLAGQELNKGADLQFTELSEDDRKKAVASAFAMMIRTGVQRITQQEFLELKQQSDRNTYLFDVRSADEFMQGHLPSAIHAPGGQLVQETDHQVAVRGARIVLYDSDMVRAPMTASWLAQMGWDVCVLTDVHPNQLQTVPEQTQQLPPPVEVVKEVDASTLKKWLANRNNLTLVIDVGDSATYVKRHIPGAWWLLRSQIQQDFTRVHKANRYVLTCADGKASRYAVADLQKLVRPGVEVFCLTGGNTSWLEQGFSTQQGESYVASPRIDRYKRPYEGTNNPVEAMQGYLEWEFGLVEQLRKDATHGFKVI